MSLDPDLLYKRLMEPLGAMTEAEEEKNYWDRQRLRERLEREFPDYMKSRELLNRLIKKRENGNGVNP